MKAQIPLKPSTSALPRRSIPALLLLLLLLLALTLPATLRAADYTWNTLTSGTKTWTNPAVWTGVCPPVSPNYPGKTIGDYDTVDFRVATTAAQTVRPQQAATTLLFI